MCLFPNLFPDLSNRGPGKVEQKHGKIYVQQSRTSLASLVLETEKADTLAILLHRNLHFEVALNPVVAIYSTRRLVSALKVTISKPAAKFKVAKYRPIFTNIRS